MPGSKAIRRSLAAILSGGVSYLGGSWLAARSLSRRLVSAQGLKPATARREDLIAALSHAVPIAEDFRHAGSARHPVQLAAVFASPGGAAQRPTLLFTHGKGGNAAEWQPDALRALGAGYNVLLPELRGHAPSGGTFVTYGLLEKRISSMPLAGSRTASASTPASSACIPARPAPPSRSSLRRTPEASGPSGSSLPSRTRQPWPAITFHAQPGCRGLSCT